MQHREPPGLGQLTLGDRSGSRNPWFANKALNRRQDLIFRASRPKSEEDIKIYKELLNQGMVMPTKMELFTCRIDGSGLRQVTNLGGANWAPYYSRDGKKIIFHTGWWHGNNSILVRLIEDSATIIVLGSARSKPLVWQEEKQ